MQGAGGAPRLSGEEANAKLRRLREKMASALNARKKQRVESTLGQAAIASAELMVRAVGGPDATFREGQKETIESVLAGRDTLLLKACGGGKSLTFYVLLASRCTWDTFHTPQLYPSIAHGSDAHVGDTVCHCERGRGGR